MIKTVNIYEIHHFCKYYDLYKLYIVLTTLCHIPDHTMVQPCYGLTDFFQVILNCSSLKIGEAGQADRGRRELPSQLATRAN